MIEFKKAFFDEAAKIFTAFVTWGVGVLLMLSYCLFIYWLELMFGTLVMIVGAMTFLTISFFAIDLWWGYRRLK